MVYWLQAISSPFSFHSRWPGIDSFKKFREGVEGEDAGGEQGRDQFSSVQSLSRVWLFATPWIAARQASLSITNSRSSFKLASIELVTPSSHRILCRPLLLLPPIPPSISLFQWVNSSHEVAKVLEFQLWHHSFRRTPRTDLL